MPGAAELLLKIQIISICKILIFIGKVAFQSGTDKICKFLPIVSILLEKMKR